MKPRLAAMVAGLIAVSGLIAASPTPSAAAPAPSASPRLTGLGVRDARVARDALPEIDRDHLFVRYRNRPADLPSRLARAGVRAERALRSGWTRLDTTRDAQDVKEALERDPAIARVAHSYVRRASSMPTDPLWSSGQKSYLLPLRMNRVWDITRGQYRDENNNLVPITVAVLDSGVNTKHPDLSGRLLAGRNIIANNTNVNDDYGHGTLVTGTLAANIDNGRGVTGVAPRVKVVPVKVLDAQGSGTDADIIEGIYWAADHPDVRVINLSLGGPGANPALDDAIAYARNDKDIVVVAAAGNGGAEGVDFPAASPGVIAVSATSHTGELAAFSSWGWDVDVAAPGLEITSTALGSSPTSDAYAAVSGTSLASPIVAGVVALVRAHDHEMAHQDVEDLILETARDIGPPGIDRAFGHGMIDPLAALGGRPLAPKPTLPLGGDEPNDTPATATTLAVGVTKNAQIAPETDEDWYSVTLGTSWYSVTVSEGNGDLDKNMQPIIELYDANGNFLHGQEFAGGPLVFNNTSPGPYKLRVRNRGGDANPYTVKVSTRSEPDIYEWPISVPFGVAAKSVGIGDVTGDDRNDVVLMVSDPFLTDDLIVIVEQTPFRSFVVNEVYTVAGVTNGNGLVVADADGDDDADILYPTTAGVVLLRQDDDGFMQFTGIGSGSVNQIAVADIDGDSKPEIVTTGLTGVKVVWGDGVTALTTVTSTSATSIAVGDINGDEQPDIVAAGGGGVLTALYAGDHEFGTVSVESISNVSNVAIESASNHVFVTIRTGSLRRYSYDATPLKLESTVLVAQRPEPLVIADVDGGGPDVVMMHSDGSGEVGYVAVGGTTETRVWIDEDPSATYDTRALAVGDLDNDDQADIVVATSFGMAFQMHRVELLPTNYPNHYLNNTFPLNMAHEVDPATNLAIDLVSLPGDVSGVRLLDAKGNEVPAAVAATDPIVIDPDDDLAPGAYTLRADGVTDTDDDTGDRLDNFGVHFLVGDDPDVTPPSIALVNPPSGYESAKQQSVAFTSNETVTFICNTDNGDWSSCTSPLTKNYSAGAHKVQVIAIDDAGNESKIATASWTYRPPPKGYWMLGAGGKVYKFGTGSNFGSASTFGAVDIEMTPSGFGYWVVDMWGKVFKFGDAKHYGNAGALNPGEMVTSISRTKNGKGYWLFTNRGRVIARGNAVFRGDLRNKPLNGPVLDSVATPSGNGYYMVASDGGVFTFGDARFYGSTGDKKISAPVRTLTPDPDGTGYWLVGRDGAVYAFKAAHRGSMAGRPLNKPVVGMVAFGNGYLMVASDGGIFNFSNKAFYGSLGANPPSVPIASVAAYG